MTLTTSLQNIALNWPVSWVLKHETSSFTSAMPITKRILKAGLGMNRCKAVQIHIEDMGNAFTKVLTSFRVFVDSIDRMFNDLVCRRYASDMVAAILEFFLGKITSRRWIIAWSKEDGSMLVELGWENNGGRARSSRRQSWGKKTMKVLTWQRHRLMRYKVVWRDWPWSSVHLSICSRGRQLLVVATTLHLLSNLVLAYQ